MPRGVWTPTEERQYRHILQSELVGGRRTATATRIAAATVNKERRARGETRRPPLTIGEERERRRRDAKGQHRDRRGRFS